MKFITVRDLRTSPASIWKQLPIEQEMVITNNGKPIALLTPLSDFNLESSLKSIRRARAQQALVQLQIASSKSGVASMPAEVIDAEISAARGKI